MPHFCYPFMKEWGSCVCGTCMVLFVLLCLLMVFIFFKKLRSDMSKESEQEDNPEVLLKNRYVKGEIDRAEFLEKKKDIEE